MVRSVAWLVDTNVISEMMRPEPAQQVAGFLDIVAVEGIGVSAITIWEVLNGIGQLDRGKRRLEIAERFQAMLDDVFEERVFAWTAEDAKVCSFIMEAKRLRGEPLDNHLPDAMIAGTAVRHGLTVITRNVRDFRNTGISVADPWKDSPC